jgi:hypothetical protein
MKRYFEFFGFKARDVVTGFAGVVTSISFDLYGCVQAIITPEMDKDGKLGESRWFYLARLEALSDAPVMPVPTFEIEHGPQDKPQFPSQPAR